MIVRNIKEAEEAISVGLPTPGVAANLKFDLSVLFSQEVQKMENILKIKALMWNEIRKTKKSDRATDRAWEAQDVGIEEMQCEMAMKRIKQLISAVNTYMNLKENEARNNY